MRDKKVWETSCLSEEFKGIGKRRGNHYHGLWGGKEGQKGVVFDKIKQELGSNLTKKELLPEKTPKQREKKSNAWHQPRRGLNHHTSAVKRR